MRAKEITSKGKPQVYLDLDGVVADFFDKYAELAIIHLIMEKYSKSEQEAFAIYHKAEERWQKEFGIRSYRDIPPAKGDPVLNMMIGTEFFNKLPKFSTADTLVSYLVDTFGEYTVLSSPLRGDYENSEKWKKEWVARELNPPPKAVIIEHRKEKYAKQADGTPNVLIDDRGNNITKWEARGGIGVKYQADENGLDTVYKGVERAFKIIKGEEEHVPQVLKSIDRTQTIATGDDEKKEVKESVEKNKETFISMFQKFLPLAVKILDLKSLPQMKFEINVSDVEQPTFGKYDHENNVLYVALGNRHPNDILRTIAHELVHHKQGTEHRLDDYSGETGSSEENEANALAGVVMRHFNKQYPEFLKQKPMIAELRAPRYLTPKDIHDLADELYVKWDRDPKFMAATVELTGKAHLDDLNQKELKAVRDWLLSLNTPATTVAESRKLKKKKRKRVAYGPGPYGWYGYDVNYSGDSVDGGIEENFADGKVKGKSRPGRVKKAGASCKGSVTSLRAKAKKYGGEKSKMYHWCANMKGGKK